MISRKSLPRLLDADRYIRDPELLTSECIFLFLTLCNVFVVYRILLDVIPYPIFVTWWQLLQGLLMAWVLGDVGTEYPKLSYFPSVELVHGLFRDLLIPTCVYCVMVCLSNILLSRTPTPASFPIVVSFTVVLHHVARFVGCGEEYMGLRWQSMLALFIGFLFGCMDSKTMGPGLLPWALAYAFFAALFRAGYLQKVMHIVEGKGNALHNHQHIIGIFLLPFFWIINGEYQIFNYMPHNPFALHTWHMWGCLITIGALPFVKNIVSNRLIRRTGQAPWRFLEIVSIFLVFCIGLNFGVPGWQGWIAILLILLGRSIGAIDAIKNAEDAHLEFNNFLAKHKQLNNPLQHQHSHTNPLLPNHNTTQYHEHPEMELESEEES